MTALVNQYGRPMAQHRMSTPSRDAGSMRGTISNYRPRRVHTQAGETAERALTQDRAEDLYANDFAARSTVDAIALNAIGTGLSPQPRIPHQRLGISPEEAKEVKDQIEWLWLEWCAQAHATGNLHFEDIQYLGMKSLLTLGELTHVPVWLPLDDDRSFSLAIQPLSPKRLRTPTDKQHDPAIRDGVHLSETGKPLGYWMASPRPSNQAHDTSGPFGSLSSTDFTYIPARAAHRPGMFHIYRADHDEQVRGVSVLAPSVKLLRNLSDSIDHELLAQVIAASFPVFIAMEGARNELPEHVKEMYNLATPDQSERRYYQDVDAGMLMYGNPGEKPEVLESKRPSQNFLAFVELILRANAACGGVSYESAMRDFSKTNYSSVRAAMNEDWKTYKLYRSIFDRRYCHLIYIMLLEEAYLRGRLILPKKAPGFYEARALWTNAYWNGPARGHIDPVKEIQAAVMAINHHLKTMSEYYAENGGDFEEGMDTIEAEEIRLATLPGRPEAPKATKPSAFTSTATSAGDDATGDDATGKEDANALDNE